MRPPRSFVALADVLVLAVGGKDIIRDIVSGDPVNPVKLDPRQSSRKSHGVSAVRPRWKIYDKDILELGLCEVASNNTLEPRPLTPRVSLSTSRGASRSHNGFLADDDLIDLKSQTLVTTRTTTISKHRFL